jgi:hypothetical protein
MNNKVTFLTADDDRSHITVKWLSALPYGTRIMYTMTNPHCPGKIYADHYCMGTFGSEVYLKYIGRDLRGKRLISAMITEPKQ